jgi:hypothetical protein
MGGREYDSHKKQMQAKFLEISLLLLGLAAVPGDGLGRTGSSGGRPE